MLSSAVTSFGVTAIAFMVYLAPLASIFHQGMSHVPGSVNAVVLALFLAFALTWAAWYILLCLVRHHPRVSAYAWTILIFVALRELLEAWLVLKPKDKMWEDPAPVSHAANIIFVIAFIAALIAVPIIHRKSPGLIARIQIFAASILAFVAISSVFTVGQVTLYVFQARNQNVDRPLHPLNTASTKPRVLWIVLDELSYKQLYEHRYPDLQMPAFDALAQQSTLFTHVIPEGRITDYVVPSLITGVNATDDRSPASGLPLTLKVNGKWQPVDPHQSVFEDAQNAGYNPAIAGWWIPYCRVFPSVVDHCYWTATKMLLTNTGMYTDQPVMQNFKAFLTSTFLERAHLLHLTKKRPEPDHTNQQYVYEHLLAASTDALKDPSLNFLYFHLNVPHPNGFFNRHTQSFSTTSTGYIDNLNLADHYLQHIRETLEAQGAWDNITVVIMGDHSWRTDFIWKKTVSWTPEEEKASDGGKFDDRPAYIVKFAGQHTPAHIDTPYAATRTRSLFQQIFAGNIRTPEELAEWAH